MAMQGTPTQARPQASSPLLGLYYGILVAALASIVIVLLILEQLGVAEATVRALMLGGPVALFAAVGAGAWTSAPAEFFHAGRRVPAFFVGIVLSTMALGGVGLMSLTGALLLVGFDALAVLLGIVAGLVVMAVLVAPFVRKAGAATLPAYLALRFASPLVGIVGASVTVAVLLLLAIAELKAASIAAGWLTGLSPGATAAALLVAIAVTVAPGGVRSLTWSSAAQSIAAFIALLVPVAIVAVIVTNLPLPQLSHGPLLRAIARSEAQSGPALLAQALAFELPGEALTALSARFATPFGAVGPVAFVLAALAVAAGIAASPVMLPRAATTVSVYETRKALGWTVFLVGTAIMSMSAIAVFLRDHVAGQLAGMPVERLPEALREAIDLGVAGVEAEARRLSSQAVLFRRDGAMVALPVLMGLPAVLFCLVAAGLVAAALAAASASLVQMAIVLADDVVMGLLPERPATDRRMAAVRIALGALLVVVGLLAFWLPGDPLSLLLWALALSGSGLFPVLVLSIWWKRINPAGAVTAMATGVLVALLAWAAHGLDVLGDNAVLAAIVAVPAAIVAAIVASHLTPAPERHVLELVRDLRVPGGEAIADREARREMQMRRKRA